MDAPVEPREFSFPDAKKLLGQENSCLTTIQREVPVRLPPRYISNEKDFVKLILTSKLGKYDDWLQCIPVSYQKVKRVGSSGTVVGEDPNVYFKLVVDYIIFQPVVGSELVARVEKISKSHIGLLVHGWFNASITRSEQDTESVSVGDEVLIEVLRVNVNRRLLALDCKLQSVVKRAPPSSLDTTDMVNNHKSFADSDQEMASEDDHNDGVESVLESRKSAKKRSREEEAESDSGIDHEKTDKITNSGDKRQKKKRKKDNDQHSAKDSSSPERKKPRSEEDIYANDFIPTPVKIELPLTNEYGDVGAENQDEFNNTELTVSKKHKKSKKKRTSSEGNELDNSVLESTQTSELDTSSSKKKKKKKKHKSDIGD